MDKEFLEEEKEKEVSGGTSEKAVVSVPVGNEFSEHVCTHCGKKYKTLKFLVDFSCPHCGYGGYKSIAMWFEEHEQDNV